VLSLAELRARIRGATATALVAKRRRNPAIAALTEAIALAPQLEESYVATTPTATPIQLFGSRSIRAAASS